MVVLLHVFVILFLEILMFYLTALFTIWQVMDEIMKKTCFLCLLTHSRRDLFKMFDIGFGQIEGIIGIILAKEFFKKSN